MLLAGIPYAQRTKGGLKPAPTGARAAVRTRLGGICFIGLVRDKLRRSGWGLSLTRSKFCAFHPQVSSRVTILSDTAERARDLDEALAQAAKHRAEQIIADHRSEFDYARAKAELAEAIAQLQTIEKLRKLRISG